MSIDRKCGECSHWYKTPDQDVRQILDPVGQCREGPPCAVPKTSKMAFGGSVQIVGQLIFYVEPPASFGACDRFAERAPE